MPALILPASVVVAVLLALVFFWRLGRQARGRLEYWRGVATIWQRNRRESR